jgi:hypothetical protein
MKTTHLAPLAFAVALQGACGGTGLSSVPDLGGTLAPAGDTAVSGPVDGIKCETNEQLLFHIHAHIAIFVNGQPELLAAGIGIGPPLVFQNGFVVGGSCFSWLHTHDQTGVVHIESPITRTYTMGDFFDIWGQPLSTTQVGPVHGNVTAFLNGTQLNVDPRTLPLDAHNLVQLDVGQPTVPAQPFTFPAGL